MPRLNFIEDSAKQGQLRMNLLNMGKFLAKYKVEEGSYPELSQLQKELELGAVDFVYQKNEEHYLLSYNLDLDDDGRADDYLYITSERSGIKEQLDGTRPQLDD